MFFFFSKFFSRIEKNYLKNNDFVFKEISSTYDQKNILWFWWILVIYLLIFGKLVINLSDELGTFYNFQPEN